MKISLTAWKSSMLYSKGIIDLGVSRSHLKFRTTLLNGKRIVKIQRLEGAHFRMHICASWRCVLKGLVLLFVSVLARNLVLCQYRSRTHIPIPTLAAMLLWQCRLSQQRETITMLPLQKHIFVYSEKVQLRAHNDLFCRIFLVF